MKNKSLVLLTSAIMATAGISTTWSKELIQPIEPMKEINLITKRSGVGWVDQQVASVSMAMLH